MWHPCMCAATVPVRWPSPGIAGTFFVSLFVLVHPMRFNRSCLATIFFLAAELVGHACYLRMHDSLAVSMPAIQDVLRAGAQSIQVWQAKHAVPPAPHTVELYRASHRAQSMRDVQCVCLCSTGLSDHRPCACRWWRRTSMWARTCSPGAHCWGS